MLDLKLDHLLRLTDDVGILQHATFTAPNRVHGYCTDDNARALIFATLAREMMPDDPRLPALATRYLSFVLGAFRPEAGTFRNLLGDDRRWIEDEGPSDCSGRAVWALGIVAAFGQDESQRRAAQELLERALPLAESLKDLRPIAYALLGIDAYLQGEGESASASLIRRLLSKRLVSSLRENATEDWPWPQGFLTYDNARLAQALLTAGRVLGGEAIVNEALRSLDWLVKVQTEDGHFVPIGNAGWHWRGRGRARFDQQPIEADATVAACAEALKVCGDRRWMEEASRCFAWFLGDNDVGAPLYDASTGGCHDGLEANGVNQNEGAESTLAWLSAYLNMYSLGRASGRALATSTRKNGGGARTGLDGRVHAPPSPSTKRFSF